MVDDALLTEPHVFVMYVKPTRKLPFPGVAENGHTAAPLGPKIVISRPR